MYEQMNTHTHTHGALPPHTLTQYARTKLHTMHTYLIPRADPGGDMTELPPYDDPISVLAPVCVCVDYYAFDFDRLT
jgi:hypothetical protein